MYSPQNQGSASGCSVTVVAFLMLTALVGGVVLWFNRDELPDLPDVPSPGVPAQPVPGPPLEGAVAIVEKAVELAGSSGLCTQPGPRVVCVASAFREGSRVQSGGPSDHAWNDTNRAARDIAVRGIHARFGPPSPLLDAAVVEIGKYFGRNYAYGSVIDADNFAWKGYRVQIIWRTPKYYGHMGHIHIGACLGCPV